MISKSRDEEGKTRLFPARGKVRDLLISWRLLAHLAVSASPSEMAWLAERNRTLSLHVCLYSYFKVSGDMEKGADGCSQSDAGVLDAFIRRHLPPEALANPDAVSATVYNRVRSSFDEDDLEIFAFALALVRDFTYVCIDEEEANGARERLPRLKVTSFAEALDAS